MAWVAWMAWMAWHGGVVAYLREGKQTLVFGSFRTGQDFPFFLPLRAVLHQLSDMMLVGATGGGACPTGCQF